MTIGLTSCRQSTENGTDTAHPFVDYERSDSAEWTTQTPSTTPPVVDSADHRNNHRVIMAFVDQMRANGLCGRRTPRS